MIYQYFTIDEFDCPCCKRNMMDPAVLKMFDNARHRVDLHGIKFNISSGYRCLKHNHDIGGSRNSSHMVGVAADIECTRSRDRLRIIKALLSVGFKRIGIRKDFIHVDFDLTKDQDVMWVY